VPRPVPDIAKLIAAYREREPDPGTAGERVAFGTSGHRGSSLRGTFNEHHVLAICQAVAEYRAARGVTGPLYLGKDTHALSDAAFESAVEVLAANGVALRVDAELGYTPTPAVSHAILVHNRGRADGLADGLILTPSHNPPEDGGIKYNPPSGGPAGTDMTRAIEARANAILEAGLREVRREPYERAIRAATRHDYVGAYVGDLASVLDMDAVAGAGLRIGVDPMGGASLAYWEPVAERYGIAWTPPSPSSRRTTTAWCGWTARRRTPWRGCWSCAAASTSPSATIPTRTATGSWRPAWGCSTQTTSWRWPSSTWCRAATGGGPRWGSARRWCPAR
jgi:phosphoglucomutase